MPQKVIDLLRLLKPLRSEQASSLEMLRLLIDRHDMKRLKDLLKQDKIVLHTKILNPFPSYVPPLPYMHVEPCTDDESIRNYAAKISQRIERSVEEQAFKLFAPTALRALQSLIGPQLIAMDTIKQAAALQLCAKEPFHLLLLGDPGTGKTDILRSVIQLHPITSFGLGSGTTHAGLSVTVKGDHVEKGLLPLADNGICCIDELNLLKEQDRGALYNAMEKGFITYDKGGEHLSIHTRVRILATANPKGLRFVGKTAKNVKAQIPVDHALLSRFHVTFIIRKPDAEKLATIARHMMKASPSSAVDYTFIKNYVDYAEGLTVEFPELLHQEVVSFITQLKKQEANYVTDVTARCVIAMVRIAKAAARIELRTQVKEKDVAVAKNILLQGILE